MKNELGTSNDPHRGGPRSSAWWPAVFLLISKNTVSRDYLALPEALKEKGVDVTKASGRGADLERGTRVNSIGYHLQVNRVSASRMRRSGLLAIGQKREQKQDISASLAYCNAIGGKKISKNGLILLQLPCAATTATDEVHRGVRKYGGKLE